MAGGTTGRVKTVGAAGVGPGTVRVRRATPQPASVPSERVVLLRSIRRWLLALVALLGVALVTLADVGYAVTGSGDAPVLLAACTAGGTVAVVAAVYWLGSVTRPGDTDGRGGERRADDGDPGEPNA
jgi:hypothetical protein